MSEKKEKRCFEIERGKEVENGFKWWYGTNYTSGENKNNQQNADRLDYHDMDEHDNVRALEKKGNRIPK